MQQDIDDLPLVMREIATIMSAKGTALTLHPENGEPPTIIHTEEEAGLTHDLVDSLLTEHAFWDHNGTPETCRWLRCTPNQPCQDVLLIPVQKVRDHSRLLISVYFEGLTDQKREYAEQLYKNRAPFAIGYFRLWQLSRSRSRELAAMKSALNLTEMGTMLINRSGKLVFANRAAQEMLESGTCLRQANGTIRASDLRDSVRLQMALEHVIAANAAPTGPLLRDRYAPLLSLDRADLPPLIISVLPTEERASEPNDVAAIVYALDPARSVAEMLQPICKIYHLSPVESRLTCLLASGASLAEVAKKMRVKDVTARSYLKQIFLKTNTHRQGELVQLMLSSVIRTAPGVVTQPLEAW